MGKDGDGIILISGEENKGIQNKMKGRVMVTRATELAARVMKGRNIGKEAVQAKS